MSIPMPDDVRQCLMNGDVLSPEQLRELEVVMQSLDPNFASERSQFEKVMADYNADTQDNRAKIGAGLVQAINLKSEQETKGQVVMTTPSETASKVQKIQIDKETAKKKADGIVATDEHAEHAVVTPWKSPAVLIAGAAGAAVAAVAGAALLPVVLVGGAVAVAEHYRIGGGLVNKVANKFKLFRAKAPAGTPTGATPTKAPAGK